MKEIILAYLPFIITGILTIILWAIAKSSKDTIVVRTAKLIVQRVAENYVNVDNNSKLEIAVNLTYDTLPSWVKWIITKKQLINLVQKAYDEMKNFIKSNQKKKEFEAKHTAICAVNQTLEIAKSMDVDGDINLVSNEQLDNLKMESTERVNEIFGKMNYKTDFQENKSLLAELGFKKYF